jgi:alpha-beta hydrolase superfamily lysophospholipase
MFPKALFMLLGRVLILVSVMMTILYFLQNSLMFYPERMSHEEMWEKAERNGLRAWPESGQDYKGFVSRDTKSEYRGTVMVFHGNAGEASDRTYYVHALEPMGYRVILHEYPGYGARVGNLDEQSLVNDACLSLQMARDSYEGPLYLFGESVGSGVASGVIAQCPVSVDGVALITPWDNLPDLAQKLYWFLPVKWLVRDQYDNSENLKAYKGRVGVLYAGNDSIIPPEHAQRLYESIASEKRLWVFKNADHNSWPAWSNAPWWSELMHFLDQD